VKRIGRTTDTWGTPQDEGNMKEVEEPEVTEKDLWRERTYTSHERNP